MHEQALSKFKKISNERRFNGVKSRLIKVDMCQIFSESNQVHEMWSCNVIFEILWIALTAGQV